MGPVRVVSLINLNGSLQYTCFLLISEILASSVVGATAEEDEGNDDESQASGQPQIPKESCYEVVGTLQDPTQHKPEWVEQVFEVCS